MRTYPAGHRQRGHRAARRAARPGSAPRRARADRGARARAARGQTAAAGL